MSLFSTHLESCSLESRGYHPVVWAQQFYTMPAGSQNNAIFSFLQPVNLLLVKIKTRHTACSVLFVLLDCRRGNSHYVNILSSLCILHLDFSSLDEWGALQMLQQLHFLWVPDSGFRISCGSCCTVSVAMALQMICKCWNGVIAVDPQEFSVATWGLGLCEDLFAEWLTSETTLQASSLDPNLITFLTLKWLICNRWFK